MMKISNRLLKKPSWLFSGTQREKRGFPFAPKINHLRSPILPAHPGGGRRLWPVLLLALLAPISTQAASFLSRFDLDATAAQQWKLPDRLREISGLGLTPDGYLVAHDDERGTIYVLDYRELRHVKTFRMGQPTARDDFESVAMADGHIYVMTSLGRLYEAPEGEDRERVRYNTFDTGLRRTCEVEGLTAFPGRLLAIACKKPHAPTPIAIYFWSLDDRTLVGKPVVIPVRELAEAIDETRFNPSGLAYDERSGNFILIAARQEAIGEISTSGRFIAATRLSHRLHRQVEGIVIAPDGRLILADEGGKKRARLTVYTPKS